MRTGAWHTRAKPRSACWEVSTGAGTTNTATANAGTANTGTANAVKQ